MPGPYNNRGKKVNEVSTYDVFGSHTYVEFEGICSGDILTFESKERKVLLPELLPFICQSDAFFDHALGTSAGSLSPRTSWKALKDFEFPLPPIEEQKRIAEILWAADEAVERYRISQTYLSTTKSKILRESLDITSVNPVACTELYLYPPKNGFSPKTNALGNGAPTLNISAVRDGRISPDGNLKFAEISESKLKKFRLNTGDILVVRGNGNKDLCGKAGMVSDVPTDCFYPDILIRLVFDANKILPEFALEQWNDPVIHRKLLTYAKSTNGIWKVNGKDLRAHKLYVPTISQQEKTVKLLSHVDQREMDLEYHIDFIRKLQRQVMNRMSMGDTDV